MNKKSLSYKFLILLILSALSISCKAQLEEKSSDITLTPTSDKSMLPSITPAITETPIPPTPTWFLITEVCSPLGGERLEELGEIITQPYKTPRSGNDDGHHGVDFAYYRRKDQLGIEGTTVNAVLDGEVATIIYDKWPYGHAVIIETEINEIDPALLEKLILPQAVPTVIPDPRVNCPSGELNFQLNQTKRSIYTLYAHLKDLVNYQVGDTIQCGQKIGEVGNSGYSSNPHLHFETRIGPSGARFESMAYYTVQSTEAERYNYCVWRVSNLFQLFDPMILLYINQ